MSAPSASTLANEADQPLFRAVILDHNQALHNLLPEIRRVSYHLRPKPLGVYFLLKIIEILSHVFCRPYKDM